MGGSSHSSLKFGTVFASMLRRCVVMFLISVNACETENPLSKLLDRLSEVSGILFLALVNCNCIVEVVFFCGLSHSLVVIYYRTGF